MLEKTTRGNQEWTILDTLATLETQNTGQRQTEENRS